MNKSVLLDRLRIDRPVSPAPRSNGGRVALILAATGVLLVLLAVGAIAFQRSQPMRVEVVEPRVASGVQSASGSLLDASGYVVARRQATVSSKVTGKVVEILIEEGSRVRAGQVLARLDGSNAQAALAQVQAEAAAADASLGVARVAVDQAAPKEARRRKLHDQGFLSQEAVEDSANALDTARGNLELAARKAAAAHAQVTVARQALDDTVVRAPFDGVVTVKAAQPGEMVSPVSAGGGFTRTGIGTIVDMDSLEVDVDVAENLINRVRPGMVTKVGLNAYPDWSIPGEVLAVIPTADRAKATVSVRIGLDLKDPRIVPEMGAHVAFLGAATAAPAAQGELSVPDGAIRTDAKGTAVYVVEDGVLRRRPVSPGRKADGWTAVKGLDAGSRVVANAQGPLRDGGRARAVVKLEPLR